MKILYICNRFFPAIGGVETHVLNIANRFIRDKNSVQVVCSDMVAINTSERFKEKIDKKDGIAIRRFFSFKMFGLDPATIMPALPVYLFFNVRKFDVVHAHSYGYFSSWVPILICRILKKEIVYTPHYADETVLPSIVKKTFDFFIAGWSFRMATKIVALTNVERDILIAKFRVNPKNIVVIPNGIDSKDYSRDILTLGDKKEILFRNGIINDKKNIIIVSRIAKNKGHIYLLKAFSHISGCNLIVIGKDWGEKESLVNFVKEKNLKDVYFLDNIDNVEKNNLLKSSDVFVLPSLGGEAFGIVLLEAMANGLPVVASDVGGIRDLVVEGKNGYLVQARDIGSLQEKIEKLLYEKDSFMENYCRKFASKYDWENIYEKLSYLYKKGL